MYADWKSLIDLSFDQGVAAIAVDGLQGSIAHDNDGSTPSTGSGTGSPTNENWGGVYGEGHYLAARGGQEK